MADISCLNDDGGDVATEINLTPDTGNPYAIIEVTGGSAITCTYTNEYTVTTGHLTIVTKTAPYPAAGDETFEFDLYRGGGESGGGDLLQSLRLTTVNGQATSDDLELDKGPYTIAARQQDKTWVTTAILCQAPGDSVLEETPVVNLDTGAVSLVLPIDASVTCTFTMGRDSDYVIARTSRIIRNYMTRRANAITAAEPDLVSRLTRRGRHGGDAMDGSFAINTDLNTLSYNRTLFPD